MADKQCDSVRWCNHSRKMFPLFFSGRGGCFKDIFSHANQLSAQLHCPVSMLKLGLISEYSFTELHKLLCHVSFVSIYVLWPWCNQRRLGKPCTPTEPTRLGLTRRQDASVIILFQSVFLRQPAAKPKWHFILPAWNHLISMDIFS